MNYVIDAFETNKAVLETDKGKRITVDRRLIPSGAKEGDSLIKTKDGYVVDEQATMKRKKNINRLVKNLFD